MSMRKLHEGSCVAQSLDGSLTGSLLIPAMILREVVRMFQAGLGMDCFVVPAQRAIAHQARTTRSQSLSGRSDDPCATVNVYARARRRWAGRWPPALRIARRFKPDEPARPRWARAVAGGIDIDCATSVGLSWRRAGTCSPLSISASFSARRITLSEP